MLFQALDSKKECYAIFCEGTLYHYPQGLDLTHTWGYTPHASRGDVEYAQIWCEGKSLTDVCPEYLKDDWARLNKLARAHLLAFQKAKVNLDDICFYDSVPRKFLIDFYSVKNEITNWVFEHYKKPKNYDFMRDLLAMLDKLKGQEIKLRAKNLDFIDPKVRNSFGKIKNSSNKVIYNPWATATGRLATAKNSFPVLTLNRELRNIVVPSNDLFVEFDFNSAELRTFLGLLGEDQPKRDLHSWISEDVFGGRFNREETKRKVFAWLYNPKARNKKLNDKFDRRLLLNKYYIDGSVHTPYGRAIEVEEEKALNYMIQSTASDLFLTSMLKIDKMLSNKRSFVAFCIHDSLILDFAKEDRPLLEELIKNFSKTKFGNFETNISIGKNFGTLKRL